MSRCSFCEASPVQWHHVCGRPSPSAPYFNEIVIALCGRCHSREHTVLRRLGLEWLADGSDPLVHGLARLALLCKRLADEAGSWNLGAGSLREVQQLTLRAVEVLA